MSSSKNGEGLRSNMPASASVVDIKGLSHQFEAMKAVENDRFSFINTLLSHINTLDLEREECTGELRAWKLMAKTYQDQFEDTEKKLKHLQKDIDCNLFVLVVIDGDITLFRDDFIRDGVEGGQRAARDLQHALLSYFKNKDYFRNDHKIVTKIYSKFTGLSETYVEAGIITGCSSFHQFVQGFNMTHPLMAIVDAGDGKEGADSKVQAEFDLFRRNYQCKQIVFAGSGDNSYGNLLRPHAPTFSKSETITLIEAVPFARELRALAPKFEVVRFDEIFRDTKITIDQPQRQNDAPKALPPTSTLPSGVNSLSASAPTYANKVAKPSPNNHSSELIQDKKVITPKKLSRSIYVNSLNQRIDTPIPNFDKDIFQKTKLRKYCNRYHLHKDCKYAFCEYEHGTVVKGVQRDNLALVARLAPCINGLSCTILECSEGHRCPYGKQCKHRSGGQCRFSDEMHDVDVSDPKPLEVGA